MINFELISDQRKKLALLMARLTYIRVKKYFGC